MSDCLNCSEYDKEKHFCPKWCDVIKSTIEDVRADERRKFAEWLLDSPYMVDFRFRKVVKIIDEKTETYTKSHVGQELVSLDEVLGEYEKEQKNDRM